MSTDHELLERAHATRPRPPTVAPEFTRPQHADDATPRTPLAPALLRRPAAWQRGNSGQQAAIIQRLQQTLGNRATRRLLQRRAAGTKGRRSSAPEEQSATSAPQPAPVQRAAARPPVVIQRRIHWKAERALDYALEQGAGQDYVHAK